MVVKIYADPFLFRRGVRSAHHVQHVGKRRLGPGVRAADPCGLRAERFYRLKRLRQLFGRKIIQSHVHAYAHKSLFVELFFQRFGRNVVKTGKLNAVKPELFYFFQDPKQIVSVFDVIAERI